MTETIEQLREELLARGRNPDEVQRADEARSWDEGTRLCGPEEDGFVVRMLGRGEHDDRREVFATEAEAVPELRRRLLALPAPVEATPARAARQEEIRARMQRRAQETLASLERERSGE